MPHKQLSETDAKSIIELINLIFIKDEVPDDEPGGIVVDVVGDDEDKGELPKLLPKDTAPIKPLEN